MSYIKNFATLATSPQRKIVLELIESAFAAIAPENVLQKNLQLTGSELHVQDKLYNLSDYQRIFVIGFGKGSSGVCVYLEKILGNHLTAGWDIDVVDAKFEKIAYTKGTHPLPSQTNITFTQEVLSHMQNLTEKDFVLVVICGGGSALFESPTIPLPRLDAVNKELLRSGADIAEINTIRKHLSQVKGGSLAEKLYPARVVGLLFSDVPGNDMSVIASGPTVKDTTTLEQAEKIVEKYQLQSISKTDFVVEPSDEKYFKEVTNCILVGNHTALSAMQQKAKELGKHAVILTDRLTGDAKKVGKILLSETRNNEILLAGGETTIHVTGTGTGGRNQALVLAALPFVEENETIASFGTDGWDFTTFAGALGDKTTITKAQEQGLEIQSYLDNDDSTTFFQKVGDGIDTGKLDSNVSDLYIIAKL